MSEESKLQWGQTLLKTIDEAVGEKIIGQALLRRRLLTALITQGHVLLEGVPGLAKTLTIKSLAESVEGVFRRIQFTPDLLPADLLGTEVYRPKDGSFEIRKGPIFANFILADEINRAPAKVQSALLEIMAEKQVTIAGETFKIPRPFLVLATQNPIEQEGTYPLPEAQMDRFMMKVKVDYPSKAEELEMLNLLEAKNNYQSKTVASLEDILELQDISKSIFIDDKIKEYIVRLVAETREPNNNIELGASPRASIALLEASKAEAIFEGENYVRPQFVKNVAADILRHRIALSFEAEAEGVSVENIIEDILNKVEVP